MTLAEWKAQLAGQGTAPVAADAAPDEAVDPNSVMHGAPLRPRLEYNGNSLETDATDPEGRFLSFTDDPARYLGHAAKGVARSPLDLVKGFVGMATTRPDKTLSAIAKPIANAIKHPIDTLGYLNTHPDEVGSGVGQAVLGGALPDAANAVVEKGPGIAGRAMSTVGRGAEALGDFSAKTNKKGIVPLVTAATGHPWMTAAELAAPPVLRAAGRGLQRGGAALEGLDLSLRDRTPVPPQPPTPAEAMREKVAGARGDVEAGFSRPVASKLNGLKSSATDISYPTADVANPGELFPYQKDSLAALRETAANKKAAAPVQELANKFGENKWANDKSAQPVDASTTPNREAVLQERYKRRYAGESWDSIEADPRTKLNAETARFGNTLNDPDYAAKVAALRAPPVVNRPYETADYAMDNAFTRARGGDPVPDLKMMAGEMSPVEALYAKDPQARIGGEGRTTGTTTTPLLDDVFGQHEDLNTVGANGSDPHMAPSALDQLSQLSGRALSPADADALFKRFRNFKGV